MLTRRDRLPDVIAGLSAAATAGLTPVKVNAVLMRGVNDDEAPALLHRVSDQAILRGVRPCPADRPPAGPADVVHRRLKHAAAPPGAARCRPIACDHAPGR
jgi:hypothetical protein